MILGAAARAAFGPATKLASAARRAAAKRNEFLLSTFLLLTTGELIATNSLIWNPCRSGIHSAIHGKIRPGNVRGLRTGYKRHQRSDLINVSVAVECCGGLLRYRPIARGGIQIRIDRTRLDVVDRDTPTPDLSGQPLSKHLHGSLRGRVRHKPGDQDTFAHGRADRDDSTTPLHVLP